MCMNCVACRSVMFDKMVRVHRFQRKNTPTFYQLPLACTQNCRLRVLMHVINVSRTEHCERQRAIGTGFQQCCRKMDAHFHRSTFVRIGSERRPRAGRDGRCSEQKKGERTWRTAALRSRFEMSVTEARSWCSEWIALSTFVCAACVAWSARIMI